MTHACSGRSSAPCLKMTYVCAAVAAVVALSVLSTLVDMGASGGPQRASLGFRIEQPWRSSYAEQSQYDKRGGAVGAAVPAALEAAAAENTGGNMTRANASGHADVSAKIRVRRQADLV